jgi:Rieske Fe-S protein
MREPARDLPVVTRRDFCRLAGCAAAAAGLVACLDDGGVGQTGPLGGVDATPAGADAKEPDAPDAATAAGTCTGSPADVGTPSSFAMGSATYVAAQSVFVLRDAGGLYAMSSICTHRVCTLRAQSSQFYCPCHGARFTLNGAVINGPAALPLAHYVVCMLPNGHVGVDRGHTTAASTRLDV